MANSHSREDVATTPRPAQTTFAQSLTYNPDDQSQLKTPTRDSYLIAAAQIHNANVGSSAANEGVEAGQGQIDGAPVRTASLRSVQSGESGHYNMGSDAAGQEDGSDNDDGTSETGRPTKKKKGQRFYCTDFPPCKLSFTRSEHLARHIRKHTGERPFQCHCLRRFSRLDNLRQHAQTVHLNEDIPPESLAATGTRFQRQVRTDRVRPPGSRSRASTIGSQSSYSKGHNRNISSSSIGSISDFVSPDDARQQQQQQQHLFQQQQHHHMHQQHPSHQQQHQQHQHQQMSMGPPTPARGGLSVDTYPAATAGPDHPYYPYYNQNSTGYSTPPSVFSADPNSPVAHPGLQSPIAMVPRGMMWAQPMHARRMSVSSGSAAFGSPSSYSSNVSYMSPFTPSNASTFSNGSMITSPTSSIFSDSQFDPNTDVDMRRRTWHPGTYGGYEQRPAPSGLSYQQTADSPQPSSDNQGSATQNVRLPGIDSFDLAQQKPAAPALRPLSPMEVDTPSRPRSLTDASIISSSDGLARSARIMAAPKRRTHWYTQSAPQSLESAAREFRAPTSDASMTPRKQKRQAWYNGPMQGTQSFQPMRTPSGGSNSSAGPRTPSATSTIDYQPAIIHSNGFVERLPQGIISDEQAKTYHQNQVRRRVNPATIPQLNQEQHSERRSGDTDRLDALVAVATSENQAVQRG